MTKITAVESGGDWHDASVNHLVLPDGMVFEHECRKYRECDRSQAETFPSLHAWLVARGARVPTDDELEVVSDD